MKSRFLSFFGRSGAASATPVDERLEESRALHQRGEFDAAVALCRQILETEPNCAAAHYRIGNIQKDRGDFAGALAEYDRAIALDRNFAHALSNRAVVLGQLHKLPESLASYDQAIELDPADALTLCNRASLLIFMEQKAAALAGFERAIVVRADYAPGHVGRAGLLQERREWAAALASYDRALALDSDNPAVHYNRGTVLRELGRFESALTSYDRAIALNGKFAQTHVTRADLLQQMNRLAESLKGYDQAIALNPSEAVTHNHRGVLLQKMGRLDDALLSYDNAISLNSHYAEAWYNRGTVLSILEQFDSELASYDRAIACKPRYPEATLNRGVVLQELGRLDEAIANYREAIDIDPTLAEAHVDLAYAALKAGDWETGWSAHEWRWRAKSGPVFRERRTFEQPLWLGEEAITGKTLLVYGEQGLGDSLQFCRYAARVAELGAKIVLEVPATLVSLCDTLPGVAQVIPYGSNLPPFDFQCPLMTLPLVFRTTPETVPYSGGYLRCDAVKSDFWRQRLGAKVRPRIGLTWSGNQKGSTGRHRHFLALAQWIPHLSEEYEYYCLQTEIAAPDLDTLATNPRIRRFEEGINDFGDTAALCACMDLVISVDTSLTHVNGALGRKTWVLLPFNADWRWLNGRDDTPWYSHTRLYRQKSRSDWSAVLERVAVDLSLEFRPC